MRRLVYGSVLMSAALVVGCGADSIQAPSRSAGPPMLERNDGRSERTVDFRTIDVPGAVSTTAFGINARGDIVGSYVDVSLRSHGYVLQRDVFTTIDFPGSAGTEARGIGPSGEIVGDYWLAGEPAVNVHGYQLTTHGEFVRVDYPGHINTIAQRILPDGTILGCRHDTDMMGTMKGVDMGRRGNHEIDLFASMTNGGTPDQRRIVGLYANMALARQEGFLIDDGVFTPLVVPGSLSTAAWDMNPAGEIVGVYRNAAGFHGFLLIDEDYVSIDVPGATATRAFGINARGDIVGTYVAGGRSHGFLRTIGREDGR